jgi:glucokinase-like ROK family protein
MSDKMKKRIAIGRPSLLKEINKAILLREIRSRGPISRATLSEITNISKPTVTKLVDSLIRDNLVRKVGVVNSTKNRGKPPLLVEFNAKSGYVIGCMLEVSRIKTVLADLDAHILAREEVDIPEGDTRDVIIEKMLSTFSNVLKKARKTRQDLLGIGIGIPGIVDSENNRVMFIPHLPGWIDVDLGRILERKMKANVFMDNECRVQALAEKWFGSGIGVNNFVCIETGVGIGSGIISGGRLIRGRNNIAGEVGHMTINPDGPLCYCGGKGCWETMASTGRLIDITVMRLKDNPDSAVYKAVNGDPKTLTLDIIFKAADEKDKFAMDILEEIGYWLGLGIANVISNLDPELVIIHGEMIQGGELLLRKIKDTVKDKILPKITKDVDIIYSKLGDDVGLIGAISIVIREILLLSDSDLVTQPALSSIALPQSLMTS